MQKSCKFLGSLVITLGIIGSIILLLTFQVIKASSPFLDAIYEKDIIFRVILYATAIFLPLWPALLSGVFFLAIGDMLECNKTVVKRVSEIESILKSGADRNLQTGKSAQNMKEKMQTASELVDADKIKKGVPTFVQKIPQEEENYSTEQWICPECGRHNKDYVGICKCGKNKPEIGKNPIGIWRCLECGRENAVHVQICKCGQTKPAAGESTLRNTYTWKCPECGKENADYVGTCGCGLRKPE